MNEAAPAPFSGGMVLRRSVVIPNSRGLHARAAAKLVALAERNSACVNVLRDGPSVPAVSIMGLMMLGAGRGAEIVIEAEGWDAKEALDAVAALVEAGFNEELNARPPAQHQNAQAPGNPAARHSGFPRHRDRPRFRYQRSPGRGTAPAYHDGGD